MSKNTQNQSFPLNISAARPIQQPNYQNSIIQYGQNNPALPKSKDNESQDETRFHHNTGNLKGFFNN